MNRKWISLALAVVLAGCGTQQPASENAAVTAVPPANEQAPEPMPSPETVKPGEPGGLPDDRTPVEEGPIDAKSAQGAGQVLQLFGGLLEQRKFAEARKLWSDGGKASGMSEAEFIAPMTNMPKSIPRSARRDRWKALRVRPMSKFRFGSTASSRPGRRSTWSGR